MAQKVLVQLVDDLDGSAADDIETVKFELDGVAYEIDLTPENSNRLREVLGPFVVGARRRGERGKRGSMTRRGSRRASVAGYTKEQSKAIRDWAKANGHELAERGRLPAAAIGAYEAAHS